MAFTGLNQPFPGDRRLRQRNCGAAVVSAVRVIASTCNHVHQQSRRFSHRRSGYLRHHAIHSTTSAFACTATLHTLMQVHTLCVGQAASMGSLILAAGARRFALPNARIMTHQPHSQGIGVRWCLLTTLTWCTGASYRHYDTRARNHQVKTAA